MDSELSKAVVNREEEETKISQEPKAETATAEKPEVIQHTTPSTDQNPKIEGSGSKNSPVSTGLVDEKKTGLEQDQVQPGKSENRASQGSSQQPDSPISRHPSQAQRRSTGGSRRRSRLSSVSGASNFSRSKSIAALSGQQSVFNKRESEHQEFIKENTPRPTNDGSLRSRSVAISFAPTLSEWSLEDEEPLDETLFQHDHTYDKLHEIYQHTINGLDNSGSHGINLEPVKSLFVKLWDGIQRSHQNVVRLQQKDHDISVDLSVIMAKTRMLIKLSEDDPEIAARLRAKLESAWSLADIGEAEERKNSIKIYELREDIFMLNRNINAAAKTEGQSTVLELTKLKAQFEAQKNIVAAEAAKLHSDLRFLFEKRQELTEMKTNLEEKFKLLSEEELVYKEAIQREKKRKDRLQKAIKLTIERSEQKSRDVEELVENLNNAEIRMGDVERFVREQRVVNEEATHELEIVNNKYLKLKQDYETQAKQIERLTNDLFKRQSDLKEKEVEVAMARSMISRMNRQKEANLKKVIEFKAIIAELEEDREILKQKLAMLEKEIENAQKKLEENKRQVEHLDRERVILNRNLERAAAVANTHESQRTLHDVAVKNLQTDIGGYEREIGTQEKVIANLEKERDNYSHEAMKLAHSVALRLEEARKLDRTIFEYQKRLGRIETLLKKQQQVHDNAVYEKSLTQRQLRDTLNDAVENSVKLSHLNHQIMGLRFIVGEKDTIIHIEASRYERVLRETTFYAGEGKRLKNLAYDMQRMVEALVAERIVLKKTVAAINSEMGKQLYYTTTAESRKEVFSRKMMSKEAELKEIWGEWRILHSKVRILAYHFRNLIRDIRKIRYQIFETKKENVVKSYGKMRARKLQHEISILENIISKETCMRNSLRESMRHPINVHRWRVLECTNPDAYEMVLKSNLLTKRLVERNEVIRKQDEDLTYKQEIYCQIREALSKAPNLETPENVIYYQHLVGAKKRQYKKLQYELQASLLHAKYYEEELEELKVLFGKLRNKYFRKMEMSGKGQTNDYDSDIDLDPKNEEQQDISTLSLLEFSSELRLDGESVAEEEDDRGSNKSIHSSENKLKQ